MTLTFSLVVGRLDELNQREKQVRQFYKPLPAKLRNKPVSAGRHRFADVLEPGDVVKPISMSEVSDDDLMSERSESAAEQREPLSGGAASLSVDPNLPRRGSTSSIVSSHRHGQRSQSVELSRNASRRESMMAGSEFGTRPASTGVNNELPSYPPLAPRIAGDIGRIETQLFRSIQEKLVERKDVLRKQLYREVGLNEDGTHPDPDAPSPAPDPRSSVDPLFKPAGKMPMVSKKKPDLMKTGLASAKEIAVYETAYMVPRARELLLRKLEDRNQGAGRPGVVRVDSEASQMGKQSVKRRASVASRSGSNDERSHTFDSLAEVPVTSGEPNEDDGMDTWDEEEQSEDELMLEGDDPNMWRYKRTYMGLQDDPNMRDYYLLQVKIPNEHVDTHGVYKVIVTCPSLPGTPSHTYGALEVDEEGRILFPRSNANGDTVMTTVLLGQTMHINVYARQGLRETLVYTRMVTYDPPGPDAPRPPPPPSPSGRSRYRDSPFHQSPSRQSMRDASSTSPLGGHHRPSTAPSPATNRSSNPGSPLSRGSPVSRPESRGNAQPSSPTSKWNSSSAGTTYVKDDSGESVGEKKRKELALIRQQMRASLQQTQNQALAAMSSRVPLVGEATEIGTQAFTGSDTRPPLIVSHAPANKYGPRPGSSLSAIRQS